MNADDHSYDFFISYSSKDYQHASNLVNMLKSAGARVWVDYEAIGFGDPILGRIDSGISKSKALIFLVSNNSQNSPWCRREYESALHREIVSGQTTVVALKLDDSPLPSLLEDKRYLSVTDLEKSLPELLKWVNGGSQPETVKFNELNLSVPPGIMEALAYLLIVDQYPIGVWGRSLEPLGAAYGHAEDPGSITVSSWAADALLALDPASVIPEIDSFTSYLEIRRKKSSGAVGMRRKVGSAFVEDYDIVENKRHTAVASQYLYRHCNDILGALKSLEYVMESRTPNGAWAAMGDPTDENADPLTTGYVLGVLKNFEQANLLPKLEGAGKDLFNARYWKSGLLWLYENLLQNDGWWIYKDRSRKYCYTSEILFSVPKFWMEDPDYEKAHENLISQLYDIWRANGIGIPTGPDSKIANLETTTQFAAIVWKSRTKYRDLNKEVQTRFTEHLEPLLTKGQSDAAGWAMAASHLVAICHAVLPHQYSLSNLRDYAQTVNARGHDENEIGLPGWVSKIVNNQIITVKADPP